MGLAIYCMHHLTQSKLMFYTAERTYFADCVQRVVAATAAHNRQKGAVRVQVGGAKSDAARGVGDEDVALEVCCPLELRG